MHNLNTPMESQPIDEPRGNIITFLSLLIIFYLLLYVVNGLTAQLEMLIFGGLVPFTTHSETLLFVMFFMIVLLQGGRFRRNPLMIISIILTLFAVLETVLLPAITEYSLLEVAHSMAPYLIPLIIVGLSCSIPISVAPKHLYFLLGVLFIASFVISLFQFVEADTVIPAQSLDGNFIVPSYNFYGQIRAFSLFSSGLSAGVFYCFVGGVGASTLLNPGLYRKVVGLIVIGMSAFGAYATLTRLTMIGMAACIVSVVAIYLFRSAPKLLKFMPLIWVIAPFISLAVSLVVGAGGTSDLQNTSSSVARLYEWQNYFGQFISSNTLNILFGSATSPWTDPNNPLRQSTAAQTPIDNAYLEVLLNCGIIGLGFIVAFYWICWKFLVNKATKPNATNFVIGVTAMFAVVPFFSGINDLLPEIFMLLPLTVYLQSTRAEETSILPITQSVPTF